MTAAQITKDAFPVGKPVIVESFIDRKAEGVWFLEIMEPFRLYAETYTDGHRAVDVTLEDLIIDIDCGIKRCGPEHVWRGEETVREIFSRVRSGHLRDRYACHRTQVIVHAWSTDLGGLEFTITKLP